MATLKWRPQALSDLEAIEAYYEEVAPDYASLLVQEILEQADQLEDFPRMGRIVPEIGDDASVSSSTATTASSISWMRKTSRLKCSPSFTRHSIWGV